MEQVSSLKTGVKYKDTPIGKIPVDWEVTFLGKIAYLEYGASLPERKRNKGRVPVYGSSGIVGYHSEELIDGPGIIIGRKGTVGAINWVDKNFYPIDTTFYISKNQSKEYLKWLFYLLSNLHLERLNITTGVPGLNRKQAHSVILPIPPFSEQKKIANILTTVDDAIEKTDQIIGKTKELKKGLMQRLLTRGIGHEKFKKTEIGEIPEVWTTIKLNDAVKLSTGKPRPKDFIPEYGRDSIYPIYGGNGILGYSSKFNFENKTIILGRVGEYCGVVHRNDGKCWISDNALYIKELKYSFFDLQFLALSLEYKNLNKYKSQSGQPLISQRVLYNLQLALPPIDEQKKISAIISDTNMLENEQSHKAELEQIKKGLMQVLLTGKLRVAV